MHVHSKQPALPQPLPPRSEKAPITRPDTLSLPRVSDALSGGGARQGGSSSRNQRERAKREEPAVHHDAAGNFAAKLVALSLAALDDETAPIAADDRVVGDLDLSDLFLNACSKS